METIKYNFIDEVFTFEYELNKKLPINFKKRKVNANRLNRIQKR